MLSAGIVRWVGIGADVDSVKGMAGVGEAETPSADVMLFALGIVAALLLLAFPQAASSNIPMQARAKSDFIKRMTMIPQKFLRSLEQVSTILYNANCSHCQMKGCISQQLFLYVDTFNGTA
jgi:hypothetical protein